MYKGIRILAVIPARGGSKTIPQKNLALVVEKPLIYYTLEAGKKSAYIDKLVVSTDSKTIAELATKYGTEVVIRPDHLAMDNSSTVDAVLYTIDYLEKLKQNYDVVLLLEPTSPLRKENDIDAALELFIDNSERTDALVSVGKSGLCHPYYAKTIDDQGIHSFIKTELKTELITQRQELPDVYYPFGAVYIVKADTLRNSKTFYPERTIPYLLEGWQCFEIDNPLDLLITETILKQKEAILKMNNEYLKKRIHAVIPGGAHTYSRGDDQFPENAPALLERGEGCYVWGSDGKKYLDYGMGLRSVVLGYAHQKIDNAAFTEIKKGNNLMKSTVTELQAAEKLLQLYPGMDMVKFARNGSAVTTAAVKLARAYTGRKYIVRCADHPFHSYDDWFICSTLINRGVPEETSQFTLSFKFNDLSSLKAIFKQYQNQIACVIMEPTTHIEPEKDFLQQVLELTHEHGALLISDEIACAFRVGMATTIDCYQVTPDLITTGKAIGNGYSVNALLGKRKIMQLGGLGHHGERVFLMSSTFGGEMCSLGAMMATIDFYKKHNVLQYLQDYNLKLKEGVNGIAGELRINDNFYIEGFAGRLHFVTKDKQGNNSFELRTVFVQEMVKNHVLMPWISNSFAHGEKELEITFAAVKKSLFIYKKALAEGYENYLAGSPIKPVFRKYN